MYDDLEYKQLLVDIKEISKMSDKNNSILFDFSRRDDSIRSTISILDHSGTKEELKTVKFDVRNKFQSFITPILDEFISDNEIALNDFVDVNGDNIVTYRLITYNNDQLTIDGLTFDDGFFIEGYVKDKKINSHDEPKVLSLSNNQGMTSTYILVAIITILSIMITLLVYFE